MKKILAILSGILFLAACGGDDKSDKKTETTTSTTETPAATDNTQHPDYKVGLAIEVKQDCATCHRIEEKITGPSYRDIANKYAGSDTAVNYLAQKIIKGGSGNWGQIPMAAHPTLTQEEAKALARYVLLMKK